MRKILAIYAIWLIGGAERVIKNLLEALPTNWKKELLLFRTLTHAKEVKELEYHFPFPKNTKVSKIEKNSSISRFFLLVRYLKQSQPDIIWNHFLPYSNATKLIFLAKLAARIKAPIVCTHHGSETLSRIPLSFLKKHPGSFIDFDHDNFLDSIFRKFIVDKGISKIVSVCKDVQERVELSWGLNTDKIITIYNPLVWDDIYEMAREEPPEYKELTNTIKIVKVSRLDTYHKDFRTLLTAFALLRKEYENVRLFIVGEGSGKGQILEWIEELKLKDSVNLLGARVNPYPYVRYADVFAFSSFFEGLGNVIVEAMALGCPVVATDCPVGPRELIGNNENGILVPMRDPVAMAEGMKKIIKDQGLRKRIIENGRKKSEEFRVSTCVRKYEEIFEKVLKEYRR
jgi:glycosyltransferase involved in cell wall biosynthesis